MNLNQQLNTPLNDLIARRKKQPSQNSSSAKPRAAPQPSHRRKVQLRRDSIHVLRQPSRNVGKQLNGAGMERRANRRRGENASSVYVASRRISVSPATRLARNVRVVPGSANGRKHNIHPAVTAETRIIIDRDTNEQTIVLKRESTSRTRNGHDMKGFKMANLKWVVCYKHVTTTLQLLSSSASANNNSNY